MGRLNNKGVIESFTLLAIVTIIGAILYIPNNPIGNALGVTQKPNKTIQTDATTTVLLPATADGETLYHKDGSVAMVQQTVYKRKDLEIQQKVTLWEQFMGLNTIFIVLIIAGACGLPVATVFLRNLNASVKKWSSKHNDLTSEAQRIVLSVDEGLTALDGHIKAANAMLKVLRCSPSTVNPVKGTILNNITIQP